ncbi:hypothetical protein RQP53_21620 [Paucibacter sp. APW11]|uniref:Uncharacterized protein n=1 Tax=Roseateles aquae TaxID=3077235 RepID=A0ABU3PIP4_9BURK|nr:hypothetical protein [Paucibacter sp. APW11]MDT9001891.1 hypothetical protein [Paucibacter sp. APW11]
MFSFFHPKPVYDPRPVAVQTVQASARPAALPEQLLVSTAKPEDAPPEQPGAAQR